MATVVHHRRRSPLVPKALDREAQSGLAWADTLQTPLASGSPTPNEQSNVSESSQTPTDSPTKSAQVEDVDIAEDLKGSGRTAAWESLLYKEEPWSQLLHAC